MSSVSFISINIFQTFNFSLQQYFTISTFLFQLVRITHIWNSVKYIITNIVYYKFLNLSLTINSLSRLLNIYLSQLANPFYIKNIYRTFILVVFNPFNYTSIKQSLNYFNTLSVKNNPVQAICSIAVGSPSPLLVISILICVKNPLNLWASPKKHLINSILIIQ